MEKLTEITAPAGPLKGSICLPGSKSLSNRLLLMAAISRTDFRKIKNLSEADDTMLLKSLLTRQESHFHVKNAGTVARFLVAYLSTCDGEFTVTGDDRMLLRPMQPLIEALRSMGADITCLGEEGRLPLRIKGRKLKGGKIQIDASSSSQYISALMLIGPSIHEGIEIVRKGEVRSQAYVEMTARLMRMAGADVRLKEDRVIIPRGGYMLGSPTVEPDWSSASYWYELVALRSGSSVFLEHLSQNSLQGDAWCAELFHTLGVTTTETENGVLITQEEGLLNKVVRPREFTHHPDLAPAYAACLAGLRLRGSLTGLDTLRYKESDRIEALKTELQRTGVSLTVRDNNLIIEPGGQALTNPVFSGHNDHRIVMCLAPLSLTLGKVVVSDASVVDKSYPGFWKDLTKTGFVIQG